MTIDTVRAWRDEEYRESLSDQELAALPEHPAGAVELSDEELSSISGANGHGGASTLCQFLSVCINSVICG